MKDLLYVILILFIFIAVCLVANFTLEIVKGFLGGITEFIVDIFQ